MNIVVDIQKKSWSRENTPSLMAKSIFYYIQSSGHFYCEQDYITDRENYNTMLLVYTLNGKGYLDYRGSNYTLSENKGFLINCMEKQCYRTDQNEPWEFIWVHFNGSESQGYLETIYENNNSPVFTLSKKSIIPDAIREIQSMLKKRKPKLDILGSCLIVEILTELLLNSRQNKEDKHDIPTPIMQTINTLEKNYFLSLNLNDLAKEIGLSKYHLSRLFKKHTGYSPYEYLINYRLSQGKDLLKTTELPIYEISKRIGFNSTSHFIKVFRQQIGSTPLQFRKYWR